MTVTIDSADGDDDIEMKVIESHRGVIIQIEAYGSVMSMSLDRLRCKLLVSTIDAFMANRKEE